eukprot:3309594-Rhodomonas_salina.2
MTLLCLLPYHPTPYPHPPTPCPYLPTPWPSRPKSPPVSSTALSVPPALPSFALALWYYSLVLTEAVALESGTDRGYAATRRARVLITVTGGAVDLDLDAGYPFSSTKLVCRATVLRQRLVLPENREELLRGVMEAVKSVGGVCKTEHTQPPFYSSLIHECGCLDWGIRLSRLVPASTMSVPDIAERVCREIG